VREWLLQAGEAWVRDAHVDGFRLDAIHAVYDLSANHVLAELATRVRAQRHTTLVISESGMNDPKVMRPRERGGLGHDAAWADDFHHALRTLVTDEREGYYEEFGRVADLAKAFHRPHVHDGEYSAFRRKRFGAPADDVAPEGFVVFDQNHDQVGNRAVGDRLPPAARPLAAFCTLLSPFTPMLFMGEEHGDEAPFQFFTDHIDEEIAVATREGRRREFASFAAFAGEEVPDPQAVETFTRSKLTRRGDPALRELYGALLAARRELPREEARAEHDEEARWLRVTRGDAQLVCNFDHGREQVVPAAEGRVVLATHEGVAPAEGGVRLPPLAGALLRA
jgi:maltooligosyltrehalose trehalohydrolase